MVLVSLVYFDKFPNNIKWILKSLFKGHKKETLVYILGGVDGAKNSLATTSVQALGVLKEDLVVNLHIPLLWRVTLPLLFTPSIKLIL